MLYNKNLCNEYLELIHRLTDQDLWLCLADKRVLDNKVLSLLKLLRKLKEKCDKE